jgi:hypothetical protein
MPPLYEKRKKAKNSGFRLSVGYFTSGTSPDNRLYPVFKVQRRRILPHVGKTILAQGGHSWRAKKNTKPYPPLADVPYISALKDGVLRNAG